MKKTLILATLILISSSSAAQSDLDLSKMNDSDKNKTGLYKLSKSELSALENWLNSQQSTSTQLEKQNNAGFEAKQESERDIIEATLEKMYQDPLGNTFFKLTNGQVWKQVQSGRMNLSNNQTITIEPKMMGSWQLKGEGNRSVKVKRIR